MFLANTQTYTGKQRKTALLSLFVLLFSFCAPVFANVTEFSVYSDTLKSKGLIERDLVSNRAVIYREALNVAIGIGGFPTGCGPSLSITCDTDNIARSRGLIQNQVDNTLVSGIIRANAIRLILRAANIGPSSNPSGFSDVDGKLAANYIGFIAKAREIQCIRSADTFRPFDYVSEGEFAKMAVCVLATNDKTITFNAAPSVPTTPSNTPSSNATSPSFTPSSAPVYYGGGGGGSSTVVNNYYTSSFTGIVGDFTSTGTANLNNANFTNSVNFSLLPSLPLNYGSMLVGNSGNRATELTAGASGQVLGMVGSVPTWMTLSLPSGTGGGLVDSVFGRAGNVTAQAGDYTTNLVTEAANLYFTDTRAQNALSGTITGINNSISTLSTNFNTLSGVVASMSGINFLSELNTLSGQVASLTNLVNIFSFTLGPIVTTVNSFSGTVSQNIADIITLSGGLVTANTNIASLSGILATKISLSSLSATGPIGYNNMTGVFSWSGTTTDVPEGANLYWTQSRFDTALGLKSTSDLAEGANLYFTDTRAQNALSGTIASLSGTINTVSSNLSTLSGSFGALTTTVNTLSGSLATLVNTVNSLSGAVDATNANLVNTNNTISSLSGVVATLTTTVSTISGSLANLTNTVVSLSGALDTTNTNVANNTANIASLSGNLATTNTNLSNLTSTVNTISGSLAGLANTVSSLSGTVSTIITTVDTLSGALATTNANLASLSGQTATNTSNISTLSGSLATTNSNLTSLSGSLASLSGTVSTLASQIASLSGQAHDAVTLGSANGLTLSGQQLSLALASGASTGALSVADWIAFNNKINLTSLSGTGFITYNNTTGVIGWTGSTSGITEGTNLYFTDTRAQNALSGTLSGIQSQINTLSGSLALLSSTVNTLSGVVAGNSADINTLSGSLASTNANIASLSGVVSGLSLNLTALSGSLSSLSATVDTLSGQVVTNANTIAAVSGSLAALTTTVSTISGSLLSLSGTVSTILGSLATTNTNLATATGHILVLSGSIATLSGQIAALSSLAHDAVTLGSANGLSLSGQQISLALASGTTTGALSIADWINFNSKINLNSLSVTGGLLSYNSGTGLFSWTGTTTNIAEGSNLYFTDSRAQNALSGMILSIRTDLALATGSIVSLSGSLAIINSNLATATGNIATLSGQLSTMNTSISTLSGSLATLTTTVNTLSGNLASLSGNLANTDATLSSLSGVVAGISTNLGTLSGSLTNLTTTVNTLSGQTVTNTAIINSLSGTVAGISSTLATLSGTVNNIITDLTSLSGQTATNTSNIGTLSGSLATTNSNLTSLSGSLASLSGTVSTLASQVAALSGQAHDAVTLGSANGLTLSGQQLSLGLASGTTTGALSVSDWIAFNNKINLTSLSGTGFITYNNTTGVIGWTGSTSGITEGTNLYWTQSRFDTAFSAKSTTNLIEGTNLYFTDTRAQSALSGTVLGIRTDIATATGNISTLQNNLATATGQINTLNTNVATVTGQLVTINSNIATATGDISTLSGQISTMSTNIASLSGSLASLTTTVNTLSGSLISLTTTVSSLSGVVSVLSGQTATNTSNISTLSGSLATTNTNLSSLSGVVSSLSTTISALSGSLTTLTTTVNSLSGQTVTNTNNISTLSGQIATINTSIDSLSGAISTLSGSLATTNANLTSLSGAVATLQSLSHAAVTLGSANGLTLSGQQLSLGLASATTTGALSVADYLAFSGRLSLTSLLTGFVAASGTVTSADSLLSAFQKIQGSNTIQDTIISNLGINLATATGNILSLQTNLATATGNIVTLTSNLNTTNTNLATATGNISTLFTNLASATGNILSLQNNLATATGNIVTLSGQIATLSGLAHAAVTLGSANGLTLAGQQISLGLASSTTTGALSVGDWINFNNKVSLISGAANGLSISGSGISLGLASATTTGALSAANWNTFNNKVSLISGAANGLSISGSGISLGLASATTTGALSVADYLAFSGRLSLTSLLTGFAAASGTITAADSILQAFQKIQGSNTIQDTIISNLGINLATATGNILSLQTALATATGQIVSLSGVVAGHTTSINTLNTNLATATGQINTLNINVATITGQLVTINSNIATATGNIATIQTNLATATGQIVSLSGVVASKIGLTSLSATGGISYNSGTGLFGDTLVFNNGLSRVGNTIGLVNGSNGQVLTMSGGAPVWLSPGAVSIPVTSVFGRTGAVLGQIGDYNTSLVTESGSLYFTNARAIAAPLTGFVAGSGTITAADSILQAFQKLQGSNTVQDTIISNLGINLTTATGNILSLQTNLATATGNIVTLTSNLNTTNTNLATATGQIVSLSGTVANKIGLTSLSANGPLTYNSGTGLFSINIANSTTTGALSVADWNTFNNKVSFLSGATNGLVISGSGLSLGLASATTTGALSVADWVSFNTKLTSLNGLTATGQTFAIGTGGLDFNIVSSGGIHTFNLPDASALARGLVNTGTQVFAGAKTFAVAPTLSGFTQGSVLFAGTGGTIAQDNANIYYNGATKRLGLGTNTPVATFHNSGSTVLGAITITNRTSSGTIGTALATVDIATTFNINQTGSNITLSLPNPTDTTAGRIAYVNNVGTKSFFFLGTQVTPNSSRTVIWNGTAWVLTGNADDRISGQYRKLADEPIASNIVSQDDDHLSFSVSSGETWFFDISIIIRNGNTGGARVRMNVPTGSTNCSNSVVTNYNGAWFTNALCNTDILITGLNNYAATGNSDEFSYRGVFTAGSTGVARLQWAQRVSNATATIFLKDSTMVVTKLSGADVAEIYYAQDGSIREGEIVSLTGDGVSQVTKSSIPYDSHAIGVISTKPGIVMGEADGAGKPVIVGLAGRVPVKVSTKNGDIKPGDYITTSDIPGVGMKATDAGRVIGKALTGLSGESEGTVAVFIQNTYFDGVDEAEYANTLGSSGSLGFSSSYALDRFSFMVKKSLTKIDPNFASGGLQTFGSAVSTLAGGVTTISGSVSDLSLQYQTLASDLRTLKAQVDAQTGSLFSLSPEYQAVLDSLRSSAGELTVSVRTTFSEAVTFAKSVVFQSDVTIGGRVTFQDRDMAGTATIPAGASTVRVDFSRPYAVTPKITATADDFATFRITDKSTTGFTIEIQEPGSAVSFDWIALHVVGARNTTGTPDESPPPTSTGTTTVSGENTPLPDIPTDTSTGSSQTGDTDTLSGSGPPLDISSSGSSPPVDTSSSGTLTDISTIEPVEDPPLGQTGGVISPAPTLPDPSPANTPPPGDVTAPVTDNGTDTTLAPSATTVVYDDPGNDGSSPPTGPPSTSTDPPTS